MQALIAKLEGAEAGSRELSDEFLLALGWTRTPGYFVEPENVRWWADNSHPSPTESVDDALALVPDGWTWSGSGRDDACGYCETTDYRKPYMVIAGPMEETGGDFYEPPEAYRETHESWAATPALALCAAILRARTTEKQESAALSVTAGRE